MYSYNQYENPKLQHKGLLFFSILISALIIYSAISVFRIHAVIQITPPEGTVVYITNTGEKYHKADCEHLKFSNYGIALNDAQTLGYSACKNCKPPK